MTNSAQTSVPLGDLHPASKGKIHSFHAEDFVTERLREMGFAEGLDIEVRFESSIGKDPIVVQVGQMIVALRREEANHVTVEMGA